MSRLKHKLVGLSSRLLPLMLNTQGKQRLSILIYHRVLPEHDPMRPSEPTLESFDWQMRIMRKHFNPLPLVEAVERLHNGSLPERAVCITFDDGYADNELHALPVLMRYAIPATVFISTGFLNGGRMWNDSIIEALRSFRDEKLDLRELNLDSYNLDCIEQRLASAESIIGKIKYLDPGVRVDLVHKIAERVTDLPNDLMLTDEQVQSLASNGVTIGAHTVNHPILSSVPDDIARNEISDSKAYLEDLIQDPIEVFAYPNGKPDLDYSAKHSNLVKAMGFKAAVSTHWGVSTSQSDRFQLPRFTPWDKQELKFTIRLLANYRRIDSLIAGRH